MPIEVDVKATSEGISYLLVRRLFVANEVLTKKSGTHLFLYKPPLGYL